MAVPSDGSYGVPVGLVLSFPVTIDPVRGWKIVQDLDFYNRDFLAAFCPAFSVFRHLCCIPPPLGGGAHVFQGSQSLALSGFLIKTPYIGVILAEKHESGLSFDRDISEMGVFDKL
jgi:hypothetical protein